MTALFNGWLTVRAVVCELVQQIHGSRMHRRFGAFTSAGFTLIELSIVLVIIGLLVGGIMVGGDLIHSSQMRGQISQLERLLAAVNTFKVKYKDLPGDLLARRASSFGFATRAGSVGRGDGNGLIQGSTNAFISQQAACGETVLFWRDLSEASLIEGRYYGVDTAVMACAAAPAGTVQRIIPSSTLGGGYLIVFPVDGFGNHIQQGGVSEILANFGRYSLYNTLKPVEVHYIDSKLDDGAVATGKILGTVSAGFNVGAFGCAVFDGSNWVWDLTVDTPSCGFMMRMQ